MGRGIRAEVVAGRAVENVGAPWSRELYETARRRGRRLMCDGCKHGTHAVCESEECPCVCNDSDFRWSRTVKPGDDVLARVLLACPELRPMFGMAAR